MEIEFKYRDGRYFATKKIGRQTIEVGFSDLMSDNDCDKSHYWYVDLIVFTKRKRKNEHFAKCDITGECGVEAFAFARLYFGIS